MTRRFIQSTIYLRGDQVEELRGLTDRTKVPWSNFVRDGIDAVIAKSLELVDHPQMGLREKAWAAKLALERGWRVSRVDWQYDPGADVVVVTTPDGQAWQRVGGDAAETMATIRERWPDRAAYAEGEVTRG